LKHTRRKSPSITFPNDTKRIFADFRHKLAVPSPDAYFKEDHRRREAGQEYGLAFHAQKDSNVFNRPGPKIVTQPPRFDPLVDFKDSQRPGPASYSVSTKMLKSVKSFISSAKEVRMKSNRYKTDVPGAGTYRMQSEFGIYNVDDTLNKLETNPWLGKTISETQMKTATTLSQS